MTPNQLPPLPEPDTHCFDDDTGKDVWSYTADQMHAYALAALAKQAQEPVAWLYVDTVGERYLCFSRPTGGGTITNLYTTPPAPQVPAPDIDEAAIARMTKRGADAWAGVDAQSVRGGEQVPAPVDEEIIAGVLFDFMGWLTSREKRIVLSSADFASPAVDAIRDFAQMRGLDISKAAVRDWQARAALQSPAPQTKGGEA